jgi:hypothetical protein
MPQVMTERFDVVKSVYDRFGKSYKQEWISQAVNDTSGMTTQNFVDGCARAKELDEFPKNLVNEIRKGGGLKKDFVEAPCPKCGIYLDGEIMKDEEGRDLLYMPGLRFYKKSSGSIYDRVGSASPCTCSASKKYEYMNLPKQNSKG